MFVNIKYYILGVNDKDNINFSETIHKSFDGIRKSIDGKKLYTIRKWNALI